SISYAARLMAEEDVGVLPLLENGRVEGIVTDRDIAVRAVAGAIPPLAEVRRIMTEEVITCSPDASVEKVLALMSAQQVRRLPVCDPEGKLVGIFALADAAHRDPDKSEVGEALDEICEPAGLHSQSPIFA
ncbi:MAG: CBS domain-containing protein, partial [Alphaproteobacteria bacterium]